MSRFAQISLLGIASIAFAQPDCGQWGQVPTPDPGSQTNILYDVGFASTEVGIAVGSWSSGLAPAPLVLRWDGQAWNELALPHTGDLGSNPQVGGVGRAGQDVWVVGWVTTTYPTNNMPLVMRWNGSEWHGVQTPTLRPQNTYPFADRGGFANDIDAVAPDDIWVVGTAVGYGDASATSIGMALHFDGSSWEDIEVPLVGNRSHHLQAVSVSDTDNAWAVGHWRNVAGSFQALIVRWDGSRWHHVANPGEGAGGGDAECVVAFATDDVWVSGSFNNGSDHLIHWNGSSWDVVNAGLPGPFASFAALAPDDIWASCAINATVYHYDGSNWTPAGGPDIAGSTYVLRGWGLAAVGACDVWSVGAWSDGTLQRTLAEHLTPNTCAADFNADGALNFFDVQEFLSAFATGLPSADLTQDGVLNFFDVQEFLRAFAAGCT